LIIAKWEKQTENRGVLEAKWEKCVEKSVKRFKKCE
jgi:hypothetical protein